MRVCWQAHHSGTPDPRQGTRFALAGATHVWVALACAALGALNRSRTRLGGSLRVAGTTQVSFLLAVAARLTSPETTLASLPSRFSCCADFASRSLGRPPRAGAAVPKTRAPDHGVLRARGGPGACGGSRLR